VTAAQESATASAVWLAASITYDELVKENPPLYRGRENVLELASRAHPYETKSNGLMHWIAAPIPVSVLLVLAVCSMCTASAHQHSACSRRLYSYILHITVEGVQ
jgi:hypothetical protein